jgi:YVTN family beta-propeller protein
VKGNCITIVLIVTVLIAIFLSSYQLFFEHFVHSQDIKTGSIALDSSLNHHRIIGNIKVEKNPHALAINEITNTLYVAHEYSNIVSVIDGNTTNVTKTIDLGNGSSSYDIAVNSDTNTIYVTNFPFQNVSVVDGNTNNVTKTIDLGNGSSPFRIAVNSDTNIIYATDFGSNTVFLIDGKTNQPMKPVRVGGTLDEAGSIAVNTVANAIYVTNSYSNSISVIDGKTNNVTTYSMPIASPHEVAIDSTTGSMYVANLDSHRVYVIDGKTINMIKTIIVTGNSTTMIGPPALAVDSSNRSVYLTDAGGNSVSIINGKTNNVTESIPVGEGPEDVAVNSITDVIYVANADDDTVSIIETGQRTSETSNEIQSDQYEPASVGIKVGIKPTGIAVNPTMNLIYVIFSLFNKVVVIDGDKDKILNTIPVGKFPTDIVVDPQTNMVYVANNGEQTVSVIEGSTSKVVANITVGDNPGILAINPDKKLLYVTLEKTGSIAVINSDTNTPLGKPFRIGGNISTIAVDPDRGTVYVSHYNESGDSDSTVVKGINRYAYDVTDLRLLSTGTTGVTDIAINPKTNLVYEVEILGDLYVVDGYANRINSTLPLGSAVSTAVDSNMNRIYVTNAGENKVSVIEGSTSKVVANITTRTAPFLSNFMELAVNPITHLVYMINQDSDVISVMDGKSNKALAGITFNVKPADSGTIQCNDQKFSDNHVRYPTNTQLSCKANPGGGFAFSAWSGDLTPTLDDNSRSGPQLTFFDNLFNFLTGNRKNTTDPNINPEAALTASNYGNLTANFIQPNQVTIPTEFWAPLYALIPGFFVPSIITWLNGRRQRKHFKEYLDKIDKSDKSTIERGISKLYADGKISESQHQILKDKVSEQYKVADQLGKGSPVK